MIIFSDTQYLHNVLKSDDLEWSSELVRSLRSGNFGRALQVQLFHLLRTSKVSVSILIYADGVAPHIPGPDVYEAIHSLLKGLLVKSLSSLACELRGVPSESTDYGCSYIRLNKTHQSPWRNGRGIPNSRRFAAPWRTNNAIMRTVWKQN